jgi:predicted transcriptional regulator
MKRIYVNSDILKEAVDYINDDITFFGFISHLKVFLKKLLNNPIDINIDEYLERHGVDKDELLYELLNRGIIEKETDIDDKSGKDKFVITYKVPKKNFERKVRRLYSNLFEKNEINESELFNEDGATSCGSVMQGGGMNPDAGQYTTPLGKVQRRKIYVTKEQYEMLKETSTQDTGDYQYDVPLNFNNGKDPAYNHKNIIANGFPKKKKGIRTKIK